MLKRVFFTIIIFLCLCGKAQNEEAATTYDPYDTITHFLCTFTDNAYLIQNDSLYTVIVDDILKFRDAMCLIGKVQIDGKNVTFPIITTSRSKKIGEKIRKGHSYTIHLHRYFIIPSCGFDQMGLTVDIQIGGRIITLCDGLFSYWFTSPDLEGCQLLSEDLYKQKKWSYIEHSDTLARLSEQFVQYLANIDSSELPYFVDSVRLKSTFLHPAPHNWSLTKSQISIRDFLIPHEVRFRSTHTSDNTFNQCFKLFLNENYSFTKYSQNHIRFVETSLLDYSILERIYTLQIIWEIKSISKIFVTILSIQEKDGKFMIIGLNRSYYGYHMERPQSNYRCIPVKIL